MHCLLLMFLLRRGKECNAAADVKTMFLLLHRNLTTTIRRRRTAWKWPVVRLLLSGLDDLRVSILASVSTPYFTLCYACYAYSHSVLRFDSSLFTLLLVLWNGFPSVH
ncbi:uncharacterized protein EDB91DRAFT_217275 [Suillus paluster]|uniref:uncharacterized protein n=1 Tax=Suillus paluster TaxID=48578 RepID=UPI001B869A03|nr:uncharacterized protein EDB91DRAFT_217275 [Suillus paluster]KAG1743557.1 hypothetical protein EDB91DRAFT_217275 [Suillus paluster]